MGTTGSRGKAEAKLKLCPQGHVLLYYNDAIHASLLLKD